MVCTITNRTSSIQNVQKSFYCFKLKVLQVNFGRLELERLSLIDLNLLVEI